MSRGDDERRWRRALKKLGPANVRRHLQQSAEGDAAKPDRPAAAPATHGPPRPFVDAWYREAQQHLQRAKIRRAYLSALAVLALVAGGILYLTIQ